MKTPREILLERHQAAEPKLDAIRHRIVMELNNQATKEQRPPNFLVSLFLCCSKHFWCELVWPSRRIWAGLAAVWITLLAVNVSLRDRSPAGAMASASPEMILSFQQQERLLAELMGPDELRAAKPRAAEPPTSFVPQPRSEGRLEILMT